MHQFGMRGFTLLEVLVAFIILAMTLGIALQIFSTGLRNGETANRYMAAVGLAKTRLALVAVEDLAREGEDAGSFDDGFRWRTSVLRMPLEVESDERAPAGVVPYALQVTVFWGDPGRERRVTLTTVRLVPETPR